MELPSNNQKTLDSFVRRRKHIDVEYESDNEIRKISRDEEPTTVINEQAVVPNKTVQTKKRKKTTLNLYDKNPPAHLKEVWDLIWEKRKEVLAPVDKMGCSMLAEKGDLPISIIDWLDAIQSNERRMYFRSNDQFESIWPHCG